jgi:hypothetical protein
LAISAIKWSLATTSPEQPANAGDEGVPSAEFVVNVSGKLTSLTAECVPEILASLHSTNKSRFSL